MVYGLGFRVQGSGFRVLYLRLMLMFEGLHDLINTLYIKVAVLALQGPAKALVPTLWTQISQCRGLGFRV